MAEYLSESIAFRFSVNSGAHTVRLGNTAGSTWANSNLSTVKILYQSSYQDANWCWPAEIGSRLNAAYNSVYGSGANIKCTVSRRGRIVVHNNSPQGIRLPFTGANSAGFTAQALFGVVPSKGEVLIPAGTSWEGDYTLPGLWCPRRMNEYDSGKRKHAAVGKSVTSTKRPRFVPHTGINYWRSITWRYVHGAFIVAERAKIQAFADSADITVNDPHCSLENLVEYVLYRQVASMSTFSPLETRIVHIIENIDSESEVSTQQYYPQLDDSVIGFIALEAQNQELSLESFDITLAFRYV